MDPNPSNNDFLKLPQVTRARRLSQDLGQEWNKGLRRLHKALSASSKKKRCSYEEAISRALTEVRQNENATEKDILESLLEKDDTNSEPKLPTISQLLRPLSSNAASKSPQRSADSFLRWRSNAFDRDGSISPIENDHARRASSVGVDDRVIITDHDESIKKQKSVDEIFEAKEAQNGHSSGEEDEAYMKLEAVAKALADSGRTGLDTLRGALMHENLQTGLDKLINHILHTFHDQWSQMLEFLIPWQQMQAMFLICCLQLVNMHQVMKIFPIVSCYISFFAMIYCTLKMFHSRYWTKQAKVWRRLLNVFQFQRVPSTSPRRHSSVGTPIVDPGLDPKQDGKKEKEPYGNFFLALAAFIFSFALADRRMMPNVFPLCALSIFFSITCIIVLTEKPHDAWAKWAMALDIFAVLPYICEKRLHWGTISIFDNLITLRLGAMKLGLGLSSLAVAIVILMYLFMAFLSPSKQGFRTVIIPHLVCFSWWHTGLEMFISCNTSFEWRHAILTTVIIWLILFPTWTAGGAFVAVAMIQMKDVFHTVNMLKAISIILVFCLPYAYKRLMKYMEEHGKWTNVLSTWKGRQSKVVLVYVGLVLISTAILYGGRESPDMLKKKISNLTWSEFHQHCTSFDEDLTASIGPDYDGNLLLRQIACSEFGSTVIEWTGIVDTVKITNIENFLESIFYYLPDSLAQRLRCLYGSKTDAFNGTTSTRRLCTVAQYNVYTFELEVKGPWVGKNLSDTSQIGPGIAVVEASDVFETIAMDLQRGDIINFTAILDDDILNYPPRLNLLQIECLKCPRVFGNKHSSRVVSEAFYSEDHWFWTKLYNACRFVFNFACAPLMIIE